MSGISSPLTLATPSALTAPPTTVHPADFEFLRALLRGKSAIVLDDGKEYLVESRLAPVLREAQLPTIRDLVQSLRGRNAALEAKVVDAMTTNETSWFRDIHPFEAMRTTLLPELLERRKGAQDITIWCAAASSGQEPYSLAMLIREHFPQLASWSVRILATDLSPSMIERARGGHYSQLEMNRGLPAAYLVKYFERAGAEWQVKSEIRSMVEYKLLNLAEPWPTMPPLDMLFIRNVLIYFDRDTKRSILGSARKVLRPEGTLVLGSSETTFNIDDGWASRTIGKAILYQPQ
jgi:chemotaxis protein methyltransferase CheR